MQRLTQQGQRKINDIAQQYNVSTDAVMTLLQAVLNGNGTMAQFNHPELGGGGQWMQGGMTMVSDMFNNNLKTIVDGICVELSNLLTTQPFIPTPLTRQSQNLGGQQQQQGGCTSNNSVNQFMSSPTGISGNWWPSELGVPTMTGTQNNMHYAYFADQKRLAIEMNGQVTLFNTLDHQFSGVSQQQGMGTSVTFTSQYGLVDVLSLPVISSDIASADISTPPPTSVSLSDSTDNMPSESPNTNPPILMDNLPTETSIPLAQNVPVQSPDSFQESDILSTIERLAELKQKHILTEEEFIAKKAELLSRL